MSTVYKRSKILILIITFLAILYCIKIHPVISEPQNTLNKEIITDDGHTMLIGLCDRNGLLGMPYKTWFEKEYNEYRVDTGTLETLRVSKNPEGLATDGLATEDLANINALHKDVRIVIFMATWCGDSKEQVPRFYKILDSLNYDESDLTLINLDRQKKSPANEEKGMDIQYVPTFIFYSNNKEIGRIIESPGQSLEKDMTEIILGNSLPVDK
ncbi:MAG: thioredoxin family protein [Bacteroidota bacterium]